MNTQEELVRAIKQCYDPEIPVNVYDLGLIYDVQEENGNVQVKMTLTSQSCPSARQIPDMIRAKLQALPQVKQVNIEVVWEPVWHPSRISAEGRKILKLDEA